MQRSSADASQQAPRITAPSSLVASALEAGALTGKHIHAQRRVPSRRIHVSISAHLRELLLPAMLPGPMSQMSPTRAIRAAGCLRNAPLYPDNC